MKLLWNFKPRNKLCFPERRLLSIAKNNNESKKGRKKNSYLYRIKDRNSMSAFCFLSEVELADMHVRKMK